MTRLAVVLAIAAAFLAGVSLGLTAAVTRGAEASTPRPVLQLVPLVPRETGRPTVAPAGRTAAPVPDLAPSATPEQPTAPTPSRADLLRGTASWYPAGATDAAAGPALREMLGRGWRGTTVRVCAAPGGSCVVVRLTDWCGCLVDGRERLIDLPVDAFAQLAPLSRGLVRVTVEVAG